MMSDKDIEEYHNIGKKIKHNSKEIKISRLMQRKTYLHYKSKTTLFVGDSAIHCSITHFKAVSTLS